MILVGRSSLILGTMSRRPLLVSALLSQSQVSAGVMIWFFCSVEVINVALPDGQSRHSSVSEDEQQSSQRYIEVSMCDKVYWVTVLTLVSKNPVQHLQIQDLGHTSDTLGPTRHSAKTMEWPESTVHGVYSNGDMSHLEVSA